MRPARRDDTASLNIESTLNESSQPRQASVMLLPYSSAAGSSLPALNFWDPACRWLSTMTPKTQRLPATSCAATHSAALAHVGRTIARRAERSVVALTAIETVRATPRHYLNRLSDLLFVLARVVNRANLDGLGGDDVYWHSERLNQQDS